MLAVLGMESIGIIGILLDIDESGLYSLRIDGACFVRKWGTGFF